MVPLQRLVKNHVCGSPGVSMLRAQRIKGLEEPEKVTQKAHQEDLV